MDDKSRPITSAELNFFNECGTGRGMWTIYNLLTLTYFWGAQFLLLSCSQKEIGLMHKLQNAWLILEWNLKLLQLTLQKNQLPGSKRNLVSNCIRKGIPQRAMCIFKVLQIYLFVVYELISINRHAKSHKWLQWNPEEDSSKSLRWFNLKAISDSAEK